MGMKRGSGEKWAVSGYTFGIELTVSATVLKILKKKYNAHLLKWIELRENSFRKSKGSDFTRAKSKIQMNGTTMLFIKTIEGILRVERELLIIRSGQWPWPDCFRQDELDSSFFSFLRNYFHG